MSKTPIRSFELGRVRPSTLMIDNCAILVISTFAYALVLGPLLSNSNLEARSAT